MHDTEPPILNLGKPVNELLHKNCILLSWTVTAIFIWLCSFGIILLIKFYFFEIPERISLGNFLNLGIALGTISAAIGAGFFATKQIEINNKQTKIELALRYKDHYVKFINIIRKTLWKFNEIYRDVKKLVDQIDRASGYIYNLEYKVAINNQLVYGNHIELLLNNIIEIYHHITPEFRKCQIIRIKLNKNDYFLGIEDVTQEYIKCVVLEFKENLQHNFLLRNNGVELNKEFIKKSVDELFIGWTESLKESKLIEIIQKIEQMQIKQFWATEFAEEFFTLKHEAQLLFLRECDIIKKINEIICYLDNAILHMATLNLKKLECFYNSKEKIKHVKEQLEVSGNILVKDSNKWDSEITKLYQPHTKIIADFMV